MTRPGSPGGKHADTLRGANRICRRLIETMSEGAVVVSADGGIRYCNVRVAEMLARPLDQVLGTSLRNYLPPADQQALDATLTQARTEPSRRAINLKTSEGRLVPVYLSASRPFRLAPVLQGEALRNVDVALDRQGQAFTFLLNAGPLVAGRQILGCVVTLTDFTERKQADVTRARLAAIVDSTDDAIFSTALDDTILTWNAGAERLYGYTANDMIGRCRALILPPGDSVEHVAAVLAKAARGEASEPFETQRVRKDGSTIDVSITISPMTDATGRVTGTSTIARDIRNRKRAEAELKRLNDEIQRQRLRIFKATMRTVQDIVNNLLNGFQLFRIEGEGRLPAELLALVDEMIQEAGVKLKTLGDLETVNEREMVIGMGIEYPGAGS